MIRSADVERVRLEQQNGGIFLPVVDVRILVSVLIGFLALAVYVDLGFIWYVALPFVSLLIAWVATPVSDKERLTLERIGDLKRQALKDHLG